jgi:hypothetical protein
MNSQILKGIMLISSVANCDSISQEIFKLQEKKLITPLAKLRPSMLQVSGLSCLLDSSL